MQAFVKINVYGIQDKKMVAAANLDSAFSLMVIINDTDTWNLLQNFEVIAEKLGIVGTCTNENNAQKWVTKLLLLLFTAKLIIFT